MIFLLGFRIGTNSSSSANSLCDTHEATTTPTDNVGGHLRPTTGHHKSFQDSASSLTVQVNNSLKQGYTIAPSLINLYLNLVVEEWTSRCEPLGVDVLYKCGGKVVGECTRRRLQMIGSDFLFADDTAVVITTKESMERAAHVLDDITTEWGLTMRLSKTKLLTSLMLGQRKPCSLSSSEVSLLK